MTDPIDDHPHTQMALRDLDDDIIAAVRIGRADRWSTSPVLGLALAASYLGLRYFVDDTAMGYVSLAFLLVPTMAALVERRFLRSDATAVERSLTSEPLLAVFRPGQLDIHRMQRLATKVGDLVESHPAPAVRLELSSSQTDTRLAVGEHVWPTIGRSVSNLRELATRRGIPITPEIT